jgi:hypothetical protein
MASTIVSTGTGVRVFTPVTGMSIVGCDSGSDISVGVGVEAGKLQDEIVKRIIREKIK